MKNAPMRFCGIELHHNPAKLTVQNTANIRRRVTPCAPAGADHLGLGLWVFKGEGELYGADCMEQYRKLSECFEASEKGALSLPGFETMIAYLSELSLIAEAEENVAAFRFVFIQAGGEGAELSGERTYTTEGDGESLWDIAYRYGKSIDELTRLNPCVTELNSLSAGTRVTLC